MIDAHDYTEKQNWLGLIVSPKAILEIQKIGRLPGRDKYIQYDVPVKIKADNKDETVLKVIKESTERLFVFKMHVYHQIENRIRQMKQEAINKGAGKRVMQKYENTMDFLNY